MAERDSHVTPNVLVDESAPEQPHLVHNPRIKSAHVDNSACETISPIPIVNECSDSGGSKLKKMSHKRHHRSRRLRESFQPFERINYLTDSATTFALHQSAANNMHLANIVLKPQVSRLLNDNEQLNHRVTRISEHNRTLSLERERLLTTIQNTAAILQSTVTSLGRERESRFQLEDVPKKAKSPESVNSDFLERSTKCTIKEFDNLLTALQTSSREKVESRATLDLGYGSAKSKSLSQYDIIVKWLNNETPQRSVSTNRSPTTTTSTSSSSSSTSTVCQEELDKLLESATISNEKCYTLIVKEQNEATQLPEANEPTAKADGSYKKSVSNDVNDHRPSSQGGETAKTVSDPPENMVVEMETDPETSSPHEIVENVVEESMLWLGVNQTQMSPLAEEGKTMVPGSAMAATATVATIRSSVVRKQSSIDEQKSLASSSDSQTNQDEHEEFISLCNTMIQRMDSMISRSSNTAHIKEYMLDDVEKHSPQLETATKTLITRPQRLPSQQHRQSQPTQNRRRRPHVDLRKLDRAISTSSTLSWPDIDQVEHEGDLKTVQKCLASLEIMNIRRTNQALTQTLIIKALRKLLARQFCHLSRAHREADTSDSENFSAKDIGRTAMGSGVEGAVAAPAAAAESTVQQAIAKMELMEESRPKSGEIYQIINHVSKSIIYNDMSHEFVKLHNNADYYERQHDGGSRLVKSGFNFEELNEMPQQRQHLNSSTKVTDRRTCHHRKATIRRKKEYFPYETSRTKVRAELNRLQAEEYKPIPRCWFYVGILIVLTQLHLFRWLKDFVHLVLKF
ncbi:hypothetical protein V9T40_001223 [Parthenolecanium corni]|uniref:Uncharacterized protein n=1 Tax=Parthenolecanium corni TaxID=536013 RepID=A0AAN9TCK0_9HEMI